MTDPAVVRALAALLAGLDGPARWQLRQALTEYTDRCAHQERRPPLPELRALLAALTARNGLERTTSPLGDGPADDALVPLLLDPDDAARQLGVSERTLRRLERDGEVKAVRIGRSVRFAPEDLAAFVDAKRDTDDD